MKHSFILFSALKSHNSQVYIYHRTLTGMGRLWAMMLKHPDEVYPLIKLKMAAARNLKVEKQNNSHWEFCFTILQKVSISSTLAIQQLPNQLRGPVCIFYLVLRALDTIEDDTSIATEVKVPILLDFHRYIYDREWHFSCECTKKYYKVLMDNFHHVSTAFVELEKDYQEIIEDIAMRMGRGMAKFIRKEVETIEDYDEYCHYAAGLVGIGLSRLYHTAWKEDLASDSLSNSMGLFLQKTNIIRDYLEDINEIPKCRMFWPRKIWSKYVNKLEDLKDEENSVKAVQCLNEMVTNALSHVEDCLAHMSAFRDPSILMFCAIPQMMSMGSLVMCYNNIQVFRGVVQIRHGLTAKIIDRAKTMEDVYGVFYDFSCMLKSKVDIKDPNASETLERLEIIMKTCRNSGALNNRKSYILRSQPNYTTPALMVVFFIIILAIFFLDIYPSRN